ncbi:MAG TPA: metal-dependent hydrolase [Thermoanaerobaculia bacterium]|nr:metal-dependent hydrolase [Thermoanaerobaculia bacterium]
MDNLCHTLVGAALGEAGMKRRAGRASGKPIPLAMPALLIGANLPDVDILAYAWGQTTALGFRRGWTHGVPALVLWPFILTGLLLAWDRWVRRRSRPEAEPARPRELLLLSTVAILTHPLLDWLNTYGLRWLMPFDGTWFYGDALFIVDPWIWLALSAGVVLSRLRRNSKSARWAVAAVCVYIVFSWSLQLASRQVAARALAASGRPIHRMMAGPVLANPFRREIVSDGGEGYDLGEVDWLAGPELRPRRPPYRPKNDALPGVAEAAATREGAIFLDWARFPFFLVEESPDARIVRMTDARYRLERGEGFATQTVVLPRP